MISSSSALRTTIFGLAACALAACADAPTTASSAPRFATGANATYSETAVPMHLPLRVPCSRAGWEIVPMDGVEHVTFQESLTPNGKGHVQFHVNAQGVSGYGLVTGDYYHADGATYEAYDFDIGQYPFSYSTTYSFGVQGHGNYGHIVAHELLQINYDEYGNRTVQVVKFDAECMS